MILILLDLVKVIVSALCAAEAGYEIFNRTFGDSIDIGLMLALWVTLFISASYFVNSLFELFRDLDKQ